MPGCGARSERARGGLTADAKAQLVAALVARGVGAEALNAAKAAADRASEMLASAESRLANYAALDSEIERNTASRIANWATGGGEQPSLDPDPKFAYSIARRTECQQRAAAARSAVSTLSSALETAKQKFVEADNAVSAAVTSVMVEQALPLARRLVEARREVWGLEGLLSSLGSMWLPNSGGVPRPVPLTPEILDAVNKKEPPWRRPDVPAPEDLAWRALRAALVGGDVDSRLGEVE